MLSYRHTSFTSDTLIPPAVLSFPDTDSRTEVWTVRSLARIYSHNKSGSHELDFEISKGFIRSRMWQKDRQYNCQKTDEQKGKHGQQTTTKKKRLNNNKNPAKRGGHNAADKLLNVTINTNNPQSKTSSITICKIDREWKTSTIID